MDGKMKYLACNFKNKLTKDEIITYEKNLKDLPLGPTKLILIPSYVYLSFFSNEKYDLGSQDISSFNETTLTGEITAEQLHSIGVSYCLVGHSERRKLKQEINIDFIGKINHAKEQDLNIIYCIGETLEDKEKGNTYMVLEKQISEVLNNVELKNIIIAYEPVWAIGTGITPTTKEINETIEFIKDIIDEKYECPIKVLYGGSVNLDNIAELNKIKTLDGFLVGGASLDPENVKKMLEIMN